MDWIQILTLIFGFLGGGGGITALATIKFKRKKEGAEAADAAIEALNKAIETLKGIDNDKDKEITDLKAESKELRAQIGDLQKHLADKRCECTTKGYYMCVHQGCVLRRPSLGRGKTYFVEHGQEEDFGADFYTVDELLEEHRKNNALKMIEYDGDGK